jgi:hypothetical protein
LIGRLKKIFSSETAWLNEPKLVELLILYACVQFYMHRASDYRLISDCNLKQELPVVAMVVNGSGQNE